MKTQTLDGPPVLEVANEETGRHYSADDCPGLIKKKIVAAMDAGRYCGIVFDSGLRWEWAAVTPGTDVTVLEFTRGDHVEFTITINGHAWRSFSRLAQRRDVEPDVWLSQLLGYGQSRKLEIAEMVQMIFGRPQSPEIARFEEAAARFHHRVE